MYQGAIEQASSCRNFKFSALRIVSKHKFSTVIPHLEVRCKLTDMVALAFDGIDTAEKARDKLIDLNNQFLLDLKQVVVVERREDGKVKIKDEHRLTGLGALGGAFWGLLIGLIFLIPAAGFVIGTISGAIAGHFTKYGISKEYMQQIQAAIQPGDSALFILADNVKMDRVIPQLTEFHPRVIRTSLTSAQEAELRQDFGDASSAATMNAPAPTAKSS